MDDTKGCVRATLPIAHNFGYWPSFSPYWRTAVDVTDAQTYPRRIGVTMRGTRAYDIVKRGLP